VVSSVQRVLLLRVQTRDANCVTVQSLQLLQTRSLNVVGGLDSKLWPARQLLTGAHSLHKHTQTNTHRRTRAQAP
jgi:hypothetical protein